MRIPSLLALGVALSAGVAPALTGSFPSPDPETPLGGCLTGPTPILTFAPDDADPPKELSIKFSGTALSKGATVILTVNDRDTRAPLRPDGTVTFRNLTLPKGAPVTLSLSPLRAGTLTVDSNSWDPALNGTGRRVAAMLAKHPIADGFVDAKKWPATLKELFYRIPALATDGKGRVLAVYDVRYGGGDLGDNKRAGLDLGENYSSDFGKTWSAPVLAVDVPNFRAPDGSRPFGEDRKAITPEMDIGDASILYDPGKNQFHLLAITGGGLSWAWAQRSNAVSDCVHYVRPNTPKGKWTKRTSLKEPLLSQIATPQAWPGILAGPGHGIVTKIGREGMPAGTLVFPMQAFVNGGLVNAQCFAAYSTDGGKTWKATGLTPKALRQQPHNAQENCIMELDDGSWLMMSKGGAFGGIGGRRLFFRTTDFKEWKELNSVSGIVHVQGSCLRIGTAPDGTGRYVMAHQIDRNTRAKLSLIFGKDLTAQNTTPDSEGVAWDLDHPVMIHRDGTNGEGYNSLCLLDATTLGLLYETHGRIFFERIDLTPYLK